MIDAKKLITGFLILTLGASTATWILSNNNTAASQQTAATTGAVAQVPESAFVSPTSTVPTDILALLSGNLPTSTANALNDPNNFTAAIGNSLLNGLIAANPNGIQTDSNGNGQVNMPDEQTILTEIQQSQPGQNIQIPNWEAEVAQDQAKIKISSRTSNQGITDYLQSLNAVNSKYFVATGLSQIAAAAASSTDSSTSAPSPSILLTAASDISSALASSLSISVPASMVPVQKAWIRMLVYQKNMAGLFSTDPTDPARTLLALQAEENNYNNSFNDFYTALEGTIKKESLAQGMTEGQKNEIAALVNKIFFINTANAQLSVVDWGEIASTIASTAKTWGIYLLNVAKDIALQILINVLVAQVQSHVLKWIQNSGAPMFVQNWADQYANSAILSAQNYIANNFSCVNSSIYPQIQVVLNTTYGVGGTNACQAQFDSQLGGGGIQAFYSNFLDGGFLSMGESMLPSNNFYGGLFFTAQGAGQAASQSQKILGIKINSEQGMVGVQTCADGSNPNGSHYVCDPGYTLQGNQCIDPTDPTLIPLNATQVANLGSCPDGSTPKTMSPAEATTQLLGGAIKITGMQITNPKSTAGILTALANSLVMQLANQVINYGTNAINGGIMSIDSGSITAPSSAVSVLTCDPASTTISVGGTATLSANGGFDSSGNLPNYIWTSSDGQGGTGSIFTPTYNNPGNYTVTLSDSNNDTPATCSVSVNPTSTQTTAVTCSPATQIIALSSMASTTSANFTAQGGSGTSYVWSAPGSVSTNGNSTAAFTATYDATGTYAVSVTDPTNNTSSTCAVYIQ